MSFLEDINTAMEMMKNAAPRVPCGTEENPHRYFGEKKVGERVTCLVCGDGLVVLPDGHGMLASRFEREFWKPSAPRLTQRDQGKSVFQVPPELRYYGLDMAASRKPLRVCYDEVASFDEKTWRRFKRAMRRPNRTRSTARTDLGRRLP